MATCIEFKGKVYPVNEFRTIINTDPELRKIFEYYIEGQTVENKKTTDSFSPKDEELLRDALSELQIEDENQVAVDVDAIIEDLKQGILPIPNGGFTSEDIQYLMSTTVSIEGLDLGQEFQLVSHIYAMIAEEVGLGDKDKAETVAEIKNRFKRSITAKKGANTRAINKLKKNLTVESPTVERLITHLEKEKELANVIFEEENWAILERKAFEMLAKYTSIQESDGYLSSEELAGQKDSNFSQNSLSDNGKKQGAYPLKRLYTSIKSVDMAGKPYSGFLSVPLYANYNTIDDLVKGLLTDPVEVKADFETMLNVLKKSASSHPVLKQLIKKLKNADGQMKNTFVSENAKNNANYVFAMVIKNRATKAWTAQIFNANSSSISRKLQQVWNTNLYSAGELITYDSKMSSFKLDKTKVEELYDLFIKIQEDSKSNKLSNLDLITFLEGFGIDVSSKTIEDLRVKGFPSTASTKEYTDFNISLQQKVSNNIFSLLGSQLEKNLNDFVLKDELFIEGDNKTNDPFSNNLKALKYLAKIEAKYSQITSPTSFRDGGKGFSTKPLGKLITDSTNSFKFDDSFLENYIGKLDVKTGKFIGGKAFNKESMVLKLFATNPAFRDFFKIGYVANTSLKEFGKNVYGDRDISSLTSEEQTALRFTLFSDLKQTFKVGQDVLPNTNIKARTMSMVSATMSDKDTATTLTTIGGELMQEDLNEDFSLKDPALELLYSQMVLPELNRVFDYLKRGTSNITNYDSLAGFFLMLPAVNDIKITIGKEERSVYEWFNTGRKLGEDSESNVLKRKLAESLENNVDFLADFKKGSKALISRLITQEATKTETTINETFIDSKTKGIKYLNTPFFDSKKGKTLKDNIKIASIDYAFNVALNLANSHMMYSGDIALYGAEGKTNSYFKEGKLDSLAEGKTFEGLVKDLVGVNFGKRQAALIAPRKKINLQADYLQLMLADVVNVNAMTTNIINNSISDLKERAEVTKLVKEYSEKGANKREIVKTLSEKYPAVAAYMSVEGTDAQEYTTSKEHLDVLYGQGYISDKMYMGLTNKIKSGEHLNVAELNAVFQPVKPIYSGLINDEVNGVMRMVYIKSSSFPLLPQLTKGLELDSLRKAMEEIQTETGKNVRASYQTANKVGSVNNPTKVFTPEGLFTGVTKETLLKGALTLPRANMGIQQDVPVKFTKKTEKVSLGSQLMKLLFGNGVTDIEGIVYDGKEYTGKELLNKYNQAFINIIKSKKKAFLQEFAIGKDGETLNTIEQLTKLQELLVEEAVGRDFPQQDIEALNLIASVTISNPNTKESKNISLSKKDAQLITTQEGKESYKKITGIEYSEDNILEITDLEFELPIWLGPNADRYESLLNSIITNRLVKFKLPGMSAVAGSEAGFKKSSNLNDVKGDIVHTSKWTGKLEPATIIDGVVMHTQVMISPRFRDNKGELIQFIDSEGKPNLKYIEVSKDGTYMLKENMLSPELLNISSFRIPTSSHSSASQIEIVGFLPLESGDLMIVPENLTVQKGLDFDVDKENMYLLNHFIDSNGRITKLTADRKDELLNRMITDPEMIEDLKELKEGFSNQLTEVLDRIIKLPTLDYLKEQIPLLKELTTDSEGRRVNTRSQSGIDRFINLIMQDDLSSLLEEIKLAEVSLKELKASKKELHKTFEEKKHLQLELKYLKNLRFTAQSVKDKFNAKLDEKILENEIIGITSAVLSNKDVWPKIVKPLSMDVASNNASIISKASAIESEEIFSMLTEEYQVAKMALGAVGKMGIGSYANIMTLWSLIEQSPEDIKLVDSSGKSLKITIGNKTFTGNLKQSKEQRSAMFRPTAEVLEERANTATDNEKEQIMGRLNINSNTIDVDAILAIMGFDVEDVLVGGKKEKLNLPYLLLSQPIIKDYVKLFSNKKSSLADFSVDAEGSTIKELLTKYSNDPEVNLFKADTKILTGQKMYDSLSTIDNDLQLAALKVFLQVKGLQGDFRKLQAMVGINKDGLGISYFNTIEKFTNLSNPDNIQRIQGWESLIGEFKIADSFQIEELEKDGYIPLGLEDTAGAKVQMVKPTTAVGAMNVYALHLGYKTWKDYFPYTSYTLNKYSTRVFNTLSGEDHSEKRSATLKKEILDEMKKALFSSNAFQVLPKDIAAERFRLTTDLVDDKGKVLKRSLASYLQQLSKMSDIRAKNLMTNPLLSSLSYDINIESGRSTIAYNNTEMEGFDEGYLYNSMIELLGKNALLPDFNGETYSVNMLVKDLIKYSYISGGVQAAQQFTKFIPTSILNLLGFSEKTRKMHKNLIKGGIATANLDAFLETFPKQYALHNAKKLSKVDLEGKNISGIKKIGETVVNFTLDIGDSNYYKEFISVRNAANTYDVYELNSSLTGVYTYVGPSVGSSNMVEYNLRSKLPTSANASTAAYLNMIKGLPVIPEKTTEKTDVEPGIREDVFGLKSKDVEGVLKEILKSNMGKAEYLRPLINQILPNVPQDVVIEVASIGSRGSYNYRTNTIKMSKGLVENINVGQDAVAITFVKEVVHAMTTNYLKANPNSSLATTMDLLLKEARAKLLTTEADQIGLEEYIKTINAGGMVSFKDKDKFHYLTDIYELIEVVATDQTVQQKLNQETYLKSGKSILEKFFDIVTRIYNTITKDSISGTVISTMFSIIEEDAPSRRNLSTLSKMKETDIKITENLAKDSYLFSEDHADGEEINQDPKVLTENSITFGGKGNINYNIC